MNSQNENNEIINFLCTSIFDVQGRLRANEIITNSLLKVISSNAPQLIEQIKESILDTAELSKSMGEIPSDLEGAIFHREIEQCIQRFSLYEESAKYSPTEIKLVNR